MSIQDGIYRTWVQVNRNIVPGFYRYLQAQEQGKQAEYGEELRVEVSQFATPKTAKTERTKKENKKVAYRTVLYCTRCKARCERQAKATWQGSVTHLAIQ